ncbi:hypothetical protein V6N12_033166 [Hibiscus sabdariffa]|uniref:Uncharacterized protein n=1 Tax=Hibiscus sabdariffa TaxID=183260 RepID=A0ABR2BCR1_9ROSI
MESVKRGLVGNEPVSVLGVVKSVAGDPIGAKSVDGEPSINTVGVPLSRRGNTSKAAEVVVSTEADVFEDFPPLQSLEVRHKRRGRERKTIAAISKNKYEVLASIEPEVVEDIRKPRTVLVGVTNLLQELKANKVDKLKVKMPEAIGEWGNALSLPFP